MECSGSLVIHCGFFRVRLSRFRLVKRDFAFDLGGKGDSLLGAVELSLVREADTDVGAFYQPRIIRVVLVKHDAQLAVQTKSKMSCYLIGPALIDDIDQQIAILWFNDRDARRHEIDKLPIII